MLPTQAEQREEHYSVFSQLSGSQIQDIMGGAIMAALVLMLLVAGLIYYRMSQTTERMSIQLNIERERTKQAQFLSEPDPGVG